MSPHFPPDATAGAHRLRVIAPYLAACGWEPIVLTVDPAHYEGELDRELADAFPPTVEVVRCHALPVRWTRRLGVGDLGLRALLHLARVAQRLVRSRGVDVIYITTYPVYHALIGPWLRRTRGVRFVLDIQDPWVGAWGAEVGPRADGRPDPKSTASRALAVRLERHVLPRADALTSVSSALLDELAVRYPVLASRPRLAMPIGISPLDLDRVRHAAPAPPGDAASLRLCYAGTLLPLGVGTVRALFEAIRCVRERMPAASLRVEFVGTSNRPDPRATGRVAALATGYGLAGVVTEHAPRVPFFDALRRLHAADAGLLLGTSEARYTASKLSTALAAGRPLLAIVHEGSDVTRTLRPLASADAGLALIEYGDGDDLRRAVPRIAQALERWLRNPPPRPRSTAAVLDPYLAPALARQLGQLFDQVAAPANA